MMSKPAGVRAKGATGASARWNSQGSDWHAKIRGSVLVVDDEENFLTLLQWFLAERGFEVHTASSVDAALNLAQQQSFKVALLDVRIGSANDGLFLLEELRQRLPEIKIIMMTAYPTVPAIKQALDRGAARLLTKPLDLKDLSETIDGLIHVRDR
jgi:DNA-binding NtrC family response regulator